MKKIAEHINGYTYGTAEVAPSDTSIKEFEDLKTSTGFTEQDQRYLRLAGTVLEGQTQQIVEHWRSGLIAGIPNLARHSRTPEGEANPDYLAKSNLRFQQWILDTFLRPYDQAWLDYQQEIVLRLTSVKKNKTDDAASPSHVPFRDIIAFIAVINETIKPYLASKEHSADDVEGMHRAWCKSMQVQSALWSKPYSDPELGLDEW